ncbi:MAG: hypothetical protein AAF585_11255 [Verrucomicrobiota bacterium]
MATPCEWAACAVDKSGNDFTLASDGKSVTAPLGTAESKDIGGGFIGYQFGFSIGSSESNPTGDGNYTISGGGCDTVEDVFVVQSSDGTNDHYAISITCESS